MSKVVSTLEFPIILIAGILGQKVASKLWSSVLGSDPPDTAEEHVNWPLLIPAAIVEGTFYKAFRMLVERGVRLAVARSTGTWVGRAGEGE